MGKPIHRAMRVAQVRPEGTEAVTLVCDESLPADPGQFIMLWLPGVEERPFTVMCDAPLSVTVAAVGPFTRALCALRAGDRVWVRGPYGRGFVLHGQRPLLVGGGSGIASLALLADRAVARGCRVTVAQGARRGDLVMLEGHFRALGVEPIVASDDGSVGFRGTVIEAIMARGALDRADAVYGCGPERMLQALVSVAGQRALPCWVSLERTMKCGLGVCGACHCGDRLVCGLVRRA